MPKYMIEASYSAEGLKGLAKDKASGRRAAVEKALAGVGGKLDSMYFAFGKRDVVAICDCPDNTSVAALSLATSASGLVRTSITVLLTVEETDSALAKTVQYRPPGA